MEDMTESLIFVVENLMINMIGTILLLIDQTKEEAMVIDHHQVDNKNIQKGIMIEDQHLVTTIGEGLVGEVTLNHLEMIVRLRVRILRITEVKSRIMEIKVMK